VLRELIAEWEKREKERGNENKKKGGCMPVLYVRYFT
jgi:hypothetical protein